jgi:hypothetical protein
MTPGDAFRTQFFAAHSGYSRFLNPRGLARPFAGGLFWGSRAPHKGQYAPALRFVPRFQFRNPGDK